MYSHLENVNFSLAQLHLLAIWVNEFIFPKWLVSFPVVMCCGFSFFLGHFLEHYAIYQSCFRMSTSSSHEFQDRLHSTAVIHTIRSYGLSKGDQQWRRVFYKTMPPLAFDGEFIQLFHLKSTTNIAMKILQHSYLQKSTISTP